LLESPALRISMFGLFQAWRQQKILSWPTHKSKALFQILLIEPGRLVPTDQILEYLWPDLTPQKAQNNLWVTISQLRRVLEPDLQPRAKSAYILKIGDGYCFSPESDYWLDCDAFTTHLVAAQSTNDSTSRTTAWDKARILYQGDYLEDEPYAEWTQTPRRQWRRRYTQLLENLAQTYAQNGHFRKTIALCHELLALDNTDEATYQLLMRCHVSLGERATALRVYDDALQTLQDEIGLEPMTETSELAHQIRIMEGEWKFEANEWAISSPHSPILSPFVGRAKEIAQINRLLNRADAGEGQTLFITGEPGIGKSRLVQETSIFAQRQGFVELIAKCYPVEQSMSYQPLIDLVCQLIERDDHWKKLSPVWLSELAVIVPELSEMASSGRTDSPLSDEPDENRQGRLFQAVFHLLANQAAEQKLLLVVEDIHWADPGTLQGLHYLSRHIQRVPITLVFTFRIESLSSDPDLVALHQSVQREDHVTSLSLARLSSADTSAFLEQTVDTAAHVGQLSGWLHQESEGNPFFLISLVQLLREDGLLDNKADIDWQAVARKDQNLTLPDAIRNSVRDRLRRLSQSELDVLEWMAVYGRDIGFTALQAISHIPQMILLNAVELLEERKLLVENAGQYDFDHNKIRGVVYFDLSSARRELYHLYIANRMESLLPSPENYSLLAHHFERGGEKENALSLWMLAGKHALATYAYQQAARLYERALALTEQPTAQMDAYLGLGRALMLQDDHEPAMLVLQRGLNMAESFHDDSRRSLILFALAQNASRQHRPDGGKPEVESALQAAEQSGDDLQLAQCLLLLTEVQESSGDLGSALKTATRAQIICNNFDNKSLEARALVELGFLRAQKADFDEAVHAAERSLELLGETEDHNAIAYSWNILGRALGGCGDYNKALDAFQHSQEKAELVGDRYLLAQVFNMRGWIYRELCDYENSLVYDQKGVEYAQQWDKPSPEISARLNLCLDLIHLNDPRGSLKLLDKIEEQINSGAYGFHKWRWHLRLLHVRGLCFLAVDTPAEALELANKGRKLAEASIIRKYIALNLQLEFMALAKLGRVGEAIETAETAITLADAIQYQPTRWAGRFLLSDLYDQNKRRQNALKAFSEAEGIVQTIASSLEDETLKATFLNTALPK